MSLFKYFEKRVKDGLPDPNGPLSSRVPLDEYSGAHGVPAESAAPEGNKCGPYNSYSYSAFYMPVIRHG